MIPVMVSKPWTQNKLPIVQISKDLSPAMVETVSDLYIGIHSCWFTGAQSSQNQKSLWIVKVFCCRNENGLYN